jgi:hypothetical protein
MNRNNIFSIEVECRKTVDDLKKAIKKEMAPEFDHIPAHNLVLFLVSIRIDDDDADEKLNDIDLKQFQSLLPTKPLSQVFPRVEEGHLHIVVQAPTAGGGELIYLLHKTVDLIDFGQSAGLSKTMKRRGETRSILCIKVRA